VYPTHNNFISGVFAASTAKAKESAAMSATP